MPRVSIGLPVYNGQQFIREAIDSFLIQTYEDLELIICDNASTDATQQICMQLAAGDSRIRYYRNATNIGAANNYNKVFSLSGGEYFKWAAHDDRCAPTFIARCVEVLDKYPEVVLCSADTSIIGDDSAWAQDWSEDCHLMEEQASARLRHYFSAGSWAFHPIFGLVRRKVLGATPLIANYVGADLVLLANLALVGKCFQISERLFFRREHAGRSGNLSIEQFVRWWNPENKPGFYFPHWRRLGEYLRAIWRSSMPISERGRCVIEVLRWANWHRAVLAGDISAGANRIRAAY